MTTLIIIAGVFEVDPNEIDRARAALSAMADASSRDEGCLAYGFWVDPDVPHRFLAYEQWESPAAVDAHMATPHAAAFIEVLPKLGVRSSEVWRYQATRTSRVA